MVKTKLSSELAPAVNRIQEWRDSRNWSQETLGEAIGVSAQFIGQLEAGKRQLTQKWMTALARALEIAPGELLPGSARQGPGAHGRDDDARSAVIQDSGTMDLALGRPNAIPAPTPAKPDRANKVPVLGTAECGPSGLFEYNTGDPIDYRDRPPALLHRPKVYCLYVSGDSMSPIHEAGDLLFIDGGRMPFPGRDAVIQFNPEQDGDPLRSFIKRLVRVAPDFIEVKEWQPKERIFRLPRARIRSLHLVLKNTEMY
jgi:phage repressor protein C with HTH and peptisase S24 domain